MIDIAILGATGTVGQKFIVLLQGHPHFRIKELVASANSAGKTYEKACTWKQVHAIPSDIAKMKVLALEDSLNSKILFSGLDSIVALDAENRYAELGHTVISNASSHRMEAQVPLVIPEINHAHINAMLHQRFTGIKGGGIVTNPNCATIAMCLPLAPLHREFTITRLHIQTLQAVSGAGYPGVASLDILGNIIPNIEGEEEKLESEPNKIFGSYTHENGFESANMIISAHTNRVAVVDGHTINISVEFKHKPSEKQILESWQEFVGFPQTQRLHSAPSKPVIYLPQNNRPQPMLDVLSEKGMVSSVGRLRSCAVLDFKFTALGHNTMRGAAGATILNAETILAMNLLDS